jgi:tRNA (guanine37-N1)-methyltransferase
MTDAVVRLLPGVLGKAASPHEDSFWDGLLDYPHYTRPASYMGWTVPDVLLSGNHAEVARWRRRAALRRTWERRPDLLVEAELSNADRAYVRSLEEDAEAPVARRPLAD